MVRRRLKRRLRALWVMGAMALAAGCAGPTPLGQMFSPDVYTVRAGDTLYAIAWRYERNVEDLIRWNDLDEPDRLRPGQRILLSAPSGAGGRVARRSETSASAGGEERSAGRESEGGETPAASAPDSTPPTDQAAAEGPTPTPPGTVDGSDWRWPTDGDLVGTFGNGRVYGRGIDIAGREGQAVHAAAPGRVVYSGEGLQAYGPLIIIRHSSAYLSAYAHNRRLLVSEGDSVEAGERIAEMGLAPGDEALLHFEIRRDGTPVDPLEYLPARQ